jgi:hypothetical protein
MASPEPKPVTLRSPFNGEVIELPVSPETLRVLLLAGFERVDDRPKRAAKRDAEEVAHG